jgi:hypothetical protein
MVKHIRPFFCEGALLEAEAGKFGDRRFRGIGSVNGIGHDVGAKVSPDRARGGFSWIGGAREGADARYGVNACDGEGNDGRGSHETLDLGIEGLIEQMSVMPGEDIGIEREHFAVGDFEARLLETGDDFADFVSKHRVGFDENTGCFHG